MADQFWHVPCKSGDDIVELKVLKGSNTPEIEEQLRQLDALRRRVKDSVWITTQAQGAE
jgi:hypothetical protein